jgi:glycosyltransferase involved in cell wall biosynthesis
MIRPTLTICIPSYGRLKNAQRTVHALLLQLHLCNAQLIVLDNASTEDYVGAFAKDIKFAAAIECGKLTVIRNATNIGMSANFLRAFEIAEGDWLWLVSDDDEIRFDALARLNTAIEQYGMKNGFIKFSSPRSLPFGDCDELGSLEAFIDFNSRSVDDFNSFIFISNGIYRLRSFRPLLDVGYGNLHTFIPHFMMLTAYMAQGQKIVVLNDIIVDYIVPDIGYSYGVVAGLGVGAPKHMMLKLTEEYYRRFLTLFFPHNDYKVIIDLYFHCKRDASTAVCLHLVDDYIHFVCVARQWWKMIFLYAFGTLVRFPYIFEWVIGRIEVRSELYKKHIYEVRQRY